MWAGTTISGIVFTVVGSWEQTNWVQYFKWFAKLVNQWLFSFYLRLISITSLVWSCVRCCIKCSVTSAICVRYRLRWLIAIKLRRKKPGNMIRFLFVFHVICVSNKQQSLLYLLGILCMRLFTFILVTQTMYCGSLFYGITISCSSPATVFAPSAFCDVFTCITKTFSHGIMVPRHDGCTCVALILLFNTLMLALLWKNQ